MRSVEQEAIGRQPVLLFSLASNFIAYGARDANKVERDDHESFAAWVFQRERLGEQVLGFAGRWLLSASVARHPDVLLGRDDSRGDSGFPGSLRLLALRERKR